MFLYISGLLNPLRLEEMFNFIFFLSFSFWITKALSLHMKSNLVELMHRV